MNTDGQAILAELASVDRVRDERRADPGLSARAAALRAYQAARFERSYPDLLADPRHRAATRFFLQELYGPEDFFARDAQFARIVPALTRLAPAEVVRTSLTLVRLHALSEMLDATMARSLPAAVITSADYVRAWQSTGQPSQRRRQIALTLEIGHALDRYTRNAMLRTTLRMMRRPARAAGLGELQRILETGLETFGEMRGASAFLALIEQRETEFADALFAADADHLDPLALPPGLRP